ncbi:MAG: glycosyltransferase family 2 protein, partial [Waterburya sp.]
MLAHKTINSYTLPKKKLQSLENVDIPWEAESQQSVRKVSVLTCLTMYNEDGVEFIRSIAGLARNIENCNDAEEDGSPDKFTICVIADGRERIHPTTLYWAKRLGLLPEESLKTSTSSLACSDRLSIYETIVSTTEVAMVATEVAQKHNLSITELLRQEDLPRKEKYSDRDYSRQDCYFKIIFCIKEENAGKLDSHWWFLNHICPLVEPKYFIQTDVGTVAGDRTMYRLRQTLEHDANCAAANACILTSPPSNPLKALHAWQYATFVWDKTMDWSMQALGGYVDVIPGQFAMFRWVALSAFPTVTEPKNHSPLERYFRGLQQLPPLESNLFLAEDRVLGFEILTNPQKNWTIRYVPDAIAITDECKSLGELLRQRRRWINSGNIATLYHAVHYILDHNNPKQLNVLGVMGWKITSALAIWFIPLIMFGPLLLTGIHSQTIFTDNPMLSQAIPVAVSAFVISWLMQLLLCIKNQPTKKWVNVWLHLTLSLQALILFVVNGVMLFRDPSMTILFSLIVGVPLICPLITARKISKSLFKRMIPLAFGYVFGGFVVYLLLTTNAIVNLN